MQTDTLTALLLNPFLTFGEAMKEVQATPAARTPQPVRRPSPKSAGRWPAPSRRVSSVASPALEKTS